MGNWLDGIKKAGANILEGFKNKITLGNESNDATIFFSTDGNSSGTKSLDELLKEYSDSQSAIGGVEAKEATLEEENNKKLVELYEELEETTHKDQERAIRNEISALQAEFKGGKLMLEIENQIQNSTLSQEDKNELINLYNKAAKTSDEQQKDVNQAKIEAFLESVGIGKNDEFSYILNRNLMIAQECFTDAERLKKISKNIDSDSINKLYDKRSSELEEYAVEIGNFELEFQISSLDLSDAKKTELAELYQQFTNTIDENEQAMISAKIEAFASANDIPAEALTGMNLNANEIAFSKQLALEYERLADCTDSTARDKINAEIKELHSIQNKNRSKLQIEKEFQMSNLPQEQKETLTKLYSLLNEATSTESRDKIKAEIENYMNENNIDENSLTILWANYRATDIENQNVLTELYEKLANCTSSEERNKINAEIAQTQTEYQIQSANLHAKAFIQDSNIPTETKKALISLYDQITESTDSNQLEKLNAEIQNILDNTEFDPNTNTEGWARQNLLSILEHKELTIGYEKLANTTDQTQREKINAELSRITHEYSQKFKELDTKLVKEKYGISEDNIQKDEGGSDNTEFNKIAKVIKQMGFTIPKDINSVDELRDYLDEIQTIIDEKTDDTYGSLG